VDQELATKLESELAMEKQMGDIASLRKELKSYLDEGPFTLHDAPGTEELTLTRKFGSETITITFSIDDLNNLDADPEDADADTALYDEDEPTDLQSGGAQSKHTINAGKTDDGNITVAPEDNISAADQADGDAAAAQEINEEGEDEEEEDAAPSFPAHLHIAVEKDGKGSLQIEALAQDGLIAIENVYYYTKEGKKFLTAARAGNAPEGIKEPYVGPQFANLDEDLQVLLERFLEERGVDTRLALFVPEYIEWKEQREYVRWLESKLPSSTTRHGLDANQFIDVKSFIEA
jgi:complement component 1 Q subcomponent-binding protein